MKKIIGMLIVWAGVGVVAAMGCVNIFAQQPAAQPQPQAQCSPEAKLAWYTEFRATFKTDQKKAYDLAKKYLACPVDPAEQQVVDYLTNYVGLIDKANRTPRVAELVYDKKDYPKAFELGKQVLADEPDNVKVLADLSYAGYMAANSNIDTFSVDALNYARKAIQLIESGKAPEKWLPYDNKDEALAYLNNTTGSLTLQKNPSEALPYLLKAVQLEGKLKKQPFTYGLIGDAYQAGPYAKLSADYKAKFENKDETPESKLALENINQVIDRMIDAYARAVSLSGNEAANQALKKAWMETLTTWYKYRHNQTTDGLPEMIASVMSKPLPPQPTPLTTLPTPPATTTTPTSGGTSSAGSSSATGAAAAPATTKPATPAAGTAPTTTPTSTSGSTTPAKPPAKPKTRNNHRRH